MPCARSPLHLSKGQQRIDQGAVVIDARVTIQYHLARFGIDLDFRDVAAVGNGDDVQQVPDIAVQGVPRARRSADRPIVRPPKSVRRRSTT